MNDQMLSIGEIKNVKLGNSSTVFDESCVRVCLICLYPQSDTKDAAGHSGKTGAGS